MASSSVWTTMRGSTGCSTDGAYVEIVHDAIVVCVLVALLETEAADAATARPETPAASPDGPLC